MRGLALLVGFALTVGLCVTSAASAAVDVQDASDRLGEDLQTPEQQRLSVLEMLLPNTVEATTSSAFDAALPGDDGPLMVAEHLLDADIDTPRLATGTASTPNLAPQTTEGPATAEGPSQAVGTIEPAQAQTDAGELPDYVTGDADGNEEAGSEETATTQSQGHSSADASSSIAETWNDLDDKEKAAAAAGALGLLLIGPLTLYSRIQRDDALENDTRRTIYEIVETNPGVCIQEVADEADVSYSTASYHLKRLVRMDYVTRREDGNKVLYYKNGGTFTAEERDLIPVLQNEEAMRVFHHIVENPWCYRAQVAEALGVSHTTVNWHLDRLQDADLVEEHREGRSCHLNVNEAALDRVVSTLDKLETEATGPQAAAPQAAPA